MLPKLSLNRSFWMATAALFALAIIISSASLWIGSRLTHPHQDITVIYIGADDCAPCQVWRRAHWPPFSSSPEFTRLAYREVTSSKLFDLLKDEYWPESLDEVRSTFNRTPGAPLWFVIGNQRVLLTARGIREWDEMALPMIKSLVRQM